MEETKREHFLMPKKAVLGLSSCVSFDDVLSDPELNEAGLYPCVAHYSLLIEAIQTTTLTFCPFSSRVFVGSLNLSWVLIHLKLHSSLY